MLYFSCKEFKERGINMKNDKLIGTAKVSSQGQITLPKIVRDKLNVGNGELVIFIINKDNEIKIKNANDLEIAQRKGDEKICQ